MSPTVPDLPASEPPSRRFSLIVGGPFNHLLNASGLAAADRLPGIGAAALIAGLAWGLPAALAALQWMLDPGFDGAGFFEDSRTGVRYLVAITLMVLAERSTDGHFARLIDRFHGLGIVTDSVGARFRGLLAWADARTSSRLAEALMVVAALVISFATADERLLAPGSHWAGTVQGEDVVYSWAGQAVIWISDPIFAFLFLRWMWRFVVLALLMFRISRLPLRLWPLHPDRVAGLSFLGEFPMAFSGLVFALGCVLASGMHGHRDESFVDMDFLQAVTIAWVGFTLLITLGPLTFFSAPLRAARDQSRVFYGVLVVRHLQDFERAWASDDSGRREIPLGDDSVSSLSDLNGIMEPLLGMRLIPGGFSGVRSIGAAAAAPMVVTMALELSLDEALKLAMGILF